MVTHRGIRYAMPAESIGFHANLYLYEERVRIVAGRYEQVHPRFPTRDLELSARASGPAPGLGLRRAGTPRLPASAPPRTGAPAEHFLTELIHQRPRTWKGDVRRLYTLLERIGEQACLKALQDALFRGLIGAEYVEDLAQQEGIA